MSEWHSIGLREGSQDCSQVIASQQPKHGGSRTKLYGTWARMRARCQRPAHHRYDTYGAIGISVCEEWSSFVAFRAWAMSNGYEEGMTIDRIKSSGNYCPENCQWLSPSAHSLKTNSDRGRRVSWSAFGESKSLMEWYQDSRCVVPKFETLKYRIKSGMAFEEAITKPVRKWVRATKSKHEAHSEKAY